MNSCAQTGKNTHETGLLENKDGSKKQGDYKKYSTTKI